MQAGLGDAQLLAIGAQHAILGLDDEAAKAAVLEEKAPTPATWDPWAFAGLDSSDAADAAVLPYFRAEFAIDDKGGKLLLAP